jgi:hypothetical protein
MVIGRFQRCLLMAALTLTSCGGGSPSNEPSRNEKPEEAVERQLRQVADGHADDNYKELHPAQQALVPEDLFRRCAVRNDIDIVSISLQSVVDETITIPGTSTRAEAKAVTLTIDSTVNGTRTKQTPTLRVILVDGRWRFILNSNVPTYQSGKCPGE